MNSGYNAEVGGKIMIREAMLAVHNAVMMITLLWVRGTIVANEKIQKQCKADNKTVRNPKSLLDGLETYSGWAQSEQTK